jgi:hypothetical protein
VSRGPQLTKEARAARRRATRNNAHGRYGWVHAVELDPAKQVPFVPVAGGELDWPDGFPWGKRPTRAAVRRNRDQENAARLRRSGVELVVARPQLDCRPLVGAQLAFAFTTTTVETMQEAA